MKRPYNPLSRQISEPKVIWKPQAGAQVKALSCPVFEMLIEGNRGGGKTDVLLMDFAQHVGKGWGESWKGIIFRETYPNLQDVIAKSQKWFRRIFPDAVYNRGNHMWTFKTGEQLFFRHARVVDDYWSYHGHEYPWIGWEELTNWSTEDLYMMMMSVCRCSNPDVTVRRYISTCNPFGCVPFGNVLTVENGMKPIQDIQVNELVWSVDSTGNMVKKRVIDTITYEYDGTMVVEESRGRYMEFTEDHRLPALNTDKTNHVVKHFSELPNEAKIRRAPDVWEGKDFDFIESGFDLYTYRKPRHKKVVKLTAMQYASLIGWWLSEGCAGNYGGCFLIAQKKKENLAFIEEMLNDCGFYYTYDGQQFWIWDKNWNEHLKQFGKSKEKYIPECLKSCSKPVLQKLLDSLMAGDGCENTYYTSSKKLRDDVSEICIKLGYSILLRESRGGYSDNLVYEVHFNKDKNLTLYTGNSIYKNGTGKTSNRKVEKKEVSKQRVYCLTIEDTETFFIEQKGFVWLSGNSGHNWVKNRFIDQAKPNEIIREVITKEFLQELGVPATEDSVSERVYIHSNREENEALMKADPKYVMNIAQNSNPTIRKAWIHGDWDILAGGMFDDLWDNKIHMIKPFMIPRSWKVYRAFDWGLSAPFSIGWWAISDGTSVFVDGKMVLYPRGTMIRIGEWYGWNGEPNKGLRLTNVQMGRGLTKREDDIKKLYDIPKILKGPADASIFGNESDGEDIASKITKEYYNKERVNQPIFIPSNKASGTRVIGWQLIRDRLEASINRDLETPHMYIFDTCHQFKRTIRIAPRDEDRPDDLDTTCEDHILDETRYMVLFSTTKSEQKKYTLG